MTTKCARMIGVTALSFSIGLIVIATAIYATWPDNAIGTYIHERRNRAANIRALERRISEEADPIHRLFYQAWLSEEKGDLAAAIRGFESVRDGAEPGTPLHLRGLVRLGLAYGQSGQPERELALYQGMMERYPGPSRISQAMYHLRRGERDHARRLLDDALTRDAQDGSLGPDRQFASSLRAGLGPAGAAGTSR